MNKIAQPTFLQVAQLGQPVLRKKAKEVKEIQHADIQELVHDLIATLMDVNGVGIAAPQVYRSLRLFIVALIRIPDIRKPLT